MSKATMLSELETLLRSRYARGETTVLIVDEAQSLGLELIELRQIRARPQSLESGDYPSPDST